MIVHSILRAIGGKIRVSSQEGVKQNTSMWCPNPILEAMMKHSWIFIQLIMILITGCGSSSNGDNLISITGTVSGKPFESKSGGFDLKGDSSLLLEVADGEDLCELAQFGRTPFDFQWLVVSLCIEEGSEVGKYQIEEGNPYVPCEGKIAWAEMRQISGGTPSVVKSGSGTVTLDAFSSNSISGNLQASFTDGGSVTGEFEVEFCDELDK